MLGLFGIKLPLFFITTILFGGFLTPSCSIACRGLRFGLSATEESRQNLSLKRDAGASV
jgi:hypothetical protein